MDFEEFLWSQNEEPLWNVIRNCYEKRRTLGQSLHRKAMTLFRQYLLARSFEATDRIKRDILTLYRADIGKYAEGYNNKVAQIFDKITS